MSKLDFQAKITLVSATPNASVEGGAWDVEVKVFDAESTFSNNTIQEGDVLVFDTRDTELGTMTQYNVVTVTSANASDAKLTIVYSTTNNNDTPNPDIGWCVGQASVIARPTLNNGLLPVIAPGMQGLSDRFSFYLLNYNNSVIDRGVGGGGTNLSGFTVDEDTTMLLIDAGNMDD